MPNFPKNKHFLPPDMHMNVCVLEDKKCSYFGKLDMLCFLVKPILKFTLLSYYQQFKKTGPDTNHTDSGGTKWEH